MEDTRERLRAGIWAVYASSSDSAEWRLASLSVISADRARDLAEQDALRRGLSCTRFTLRHYDCVEAVPWQLPQAPEVA